MHALQIGALVDLSIALARQLVDFKVECKKSEWFLLASGNSDNIIFHLSQSGSLYRIPEVQNLNENPYPMQLFCSAVLNSWSWLQSLKFCWPNLECSFQDEGEGNFWRIEAKRQEFRITKLFKNKNKNNYCSIDSLAQ